MQMIRKWGFALISMLTVFLTAGCGAADKARYLEKMSSMDELREFYDSHTKEEYDNRLREIKPLIDKTTDEEFRILFETSIDT